MRTTWTLPALLTVMAVWLGACSASDPGSDGAGDRVLADGKTFTLALPADPGNLDPHFTTTGVTVQLDMFLYDSLVSIDPEGKVETGLATSWEESTTEVTYTLRDGVTCSDGSPLTATDVAANITFVGKPENQSTRMGVFVPPGAVAEADEDAGTVRVMSKVPDAFLARSVGSLPIICGKGLEDRSSLEQGAAGTGMYELTDVVAGDHYTLTRRDDYAWGPGDFDPDQKGLPETVVVRVVPNESTVANLLQTGEVNAAQVLGPDRDRLVAAKLFQRDVVAPLGELLLNEQDGHPGADEDVRRALTQGLDLESVGNVLTSGEGRPPTSMVAPGQGPCTVDAASGALPAFDAEAASSALDAAGWEKGEDGIREKDGKRLSLTLYYSTSYGAPMQGGAELMQQMWHELGVDTELKGAADSEAGAVIIGGQGSWDATILPLGVTLPSQLVPYLTGPTPPNGTNFAGIDNADYAAHVATASTMAGAAGCDKWAEAEKALFEHVDVVLFVDSVQPFFGTGTSFELSQGNVQPASVRMYAG
ncbi:MAG: extracellular solute-binding protein family 5 [Nocardioides sp.]|nr:extracellular solute-binding protein family 5 [Nocardioides sp.]